MTADPIAVVERYFAAMGAGDPAVADVFHDDARLIGLGTILNDPTDGTKNPATIRTMRLTVIFESLLHGCCGHGPR